MTSKIAKPALGIILIGFLSISSIAQDVEKIFQRGNALNSEGKYAEALIYVDSSLNMDSSLYQRFNFRAQIKLNLGMIDGAIKDISKCIDKCRCTTRIYHVSNYYLIRAKLQLLIQNDSVAMEDVNKSILSNPNNWEAYNFRSGLFISKGQIQLALADLNKSFAINDNEATTLIARGNLKIKIGDIEGACSDLSQVTNWGFEQFIPWLTENCMKK